MEEVRIRRPSLRQAALFSGRLLLVAALVAAAAFLAAKLAVLVLAVFVALLATSALRPVAGWLERRRWPPSLAALLPVLVSALLFVGFVAWIVPATATEVRSRGPELAQRAQELARAASNLAPGDAGSAQQLTDRAWQAARENSQRIAGAMARGLMQGAELMAGLLLALVLTFFFVRDGRKLTERTLGLMRPERRGVAYASLRAGWRTLGRWFRGAVVIATVDAVGIGAGLLIVGVPLALPLALLTFFAAFVPVAGATVAGGAAVLVALAAGGVTDALIILAVVVAVQQLEGNVLEPWVMGHYVPLHPAVILIVVTAGALLAGIAGAFAAVPLSAALAAGLIELRHRTAPSPREEGAADGTGAEAH